MGGESGVQGSFWLNRNSAWVACHKSCQSTGPACSRSRMPPQELSSWRNEDTSSALTGVSHGGFSLFLPRELSVPSFLLQPTVFVKITTAGAVLQEESRLVTPPLQLPSAAHRDGASAKTACGQESSHSNPSNLRQVRGGEKPHQALGKLRT